jgi:uncharacterized protein (DUF58 family)
MVGNVSGQHRSPHRGSSVEFAEYRNYVPGDDVRRLDWRVFGRTDRFYLKEFEAETNLRCHLVLDCSASMAFAGRDGLRFDYARRLAATLAYLAIHQGDAAGLVCVGAGSLPDVPARRNPAHLRHILRSLDEARPAGATGLVAALHDLAERIRSRALVIIVSDLFCEEQPLLDCFQHLRFQKHDVAAFHLVDRAELAFEFEKPIRFMDLEGSASLITEPATIRQEYMREVERYLAVMRAGCHEFGVDYRLVVTDQDYEAVVGAFLVDRARAAGVNRAS